MAGCCECGDEPSCSGATELVKGKEVKTEGHSNRMKSSCKK
jgi:hypothetical protein